MPSEEGSPQRKRSMAAAGLSLMSLGQAALPSAWPAQRRVRLWTKSFVRCEAPHASSTYYGSYSGDRFGGGIGKRVGISEERKAPLPGTGVARVELFSETHETLREWATEANWRRATAVHKAAYFTRTENALQEQVLEHIRQHYVASSYVAHVPVQAALFRLESPTEFAERLATVVVRRIPSVVHGVFDEKSERCVVDFANKRLGGGWMSYGMVQEEKMFIERFDYGALCARSLLQMPDPTVEPLASPFSMHPNEAWILRGGPSFAHVDWYGRTKGDCFDRLTLLDPAEDRSSAPIIVAMDAIKASFPIYEREHLELMLAKAYTGFAAARADPDVGGQEQIATGSWGCGVFFNNERVMFVVQALAANLAGVSLVHHSLGDGLSLAPALAFMEEALVQKLTVAEALDALVVRCTEDPEWRSKYKPREKK